MSQSVKCQACGAQSSEADFCSSCGVQLTPDTAAPAAAVSHADQVAPSTPSDKHGHTNELCPKCSAERDDLASIFCGTCGYNFVTKQGGDVLTADPAPAAPAPASSSVSVPAAATASGARMDIVITVDFSVATAPKVRPSLSFPLFDDENLIGRKSSTVKQTVAIEDEAISKRHALIVRNPDGAYIIRDLNSTNGTRVNDVTLIAGADQPLKEGDVIRIGEYTVITVQAIRHA